MMTVVCLSGMRTNACFYPPAAPYATSRGTPLYESTVQPRNGSNFDRGARGVT